MGTQKVRWAVLSAALMCSGVAFAQDEAPPPPRAAKAVAQLQKSVKVDANLKDLKAGTPISPSTLDAWSGRVGFRKDVLYVGVATTDDKVLNGDILEISLFFPAAGTTARGHVWRFGPEGLRRPEEGMLPAHAAKLSEAKIETTDTGMVAELAIPARALPRFPAKEPLVFELCVSFSDRDGPAASPAVSTNCSGGTMQGEALKLPDSFRSQLKLKPPESVTGLEGRESGWVGFAVLHYPNWVASDGPLTAPMLRSLVTTEQVDQKKAGINVPDALLLPGGGTVLSVLSGEDPYAEKGACDGDKELRVAFYVVSKQRTAERVLEWPVSTCALGRAAVVEMNDEGELSMGYTNGATVNFVWSGDHFERTEIGSR